MSQPPSTPRRSERLRIAAVVVAALALAAVALVPLLGGLGGDEDGGSGPPPKVAGARETRALLAGIPQDGITLGRADAPLTLVEFADPQCPFCRRYTVGAQPQVIRRYVRTGKLKIELRMLAVLGRDSGRAAAVLAAATAQDRLWNASDLMYYNQGAENSGYVTDAWLRGVLGAVPGLDVERALAGADGPAAAKLLTDARTLAIRNAVDRTPTFLLGRTGGRLEKVLLQTLAPGELDARIDALLPRDGGA
ncbi:MAG: thioredoxin domain-containing protein [Solirubrobacterales bacterium]|nr:thioredoxin domain-containing protein [Solirubrobacterales bacterium]